MDTEESIEELVICRLTTNPENSDYEAAGAAFLGSEVGRAFGAFLEPEGMVFVHYRPARGV